MRINAIVVLLVALGGAVPGVGAHSLFEQSTFQSLTADRRALRPGDSLTVLVVENASASASANTTTNKTGGIIAGIKGDAISGAGSSSGGQFNGSLSLGEDFGGKGTVQRAGRVAAQITVTVLSVAPNQELFVSGRQQILVNGEKQLIELSGRVRPIDVSENNTIVSSRIADASINYVGDGILAEKQKQGVISRIFSWLGLL
jgi:flagellar L-ring protein precursor FlgH